MSKRKEKSKHDIWQNIEYWIKKYPNKTIEECEEIRQEKLKGRKLNNPLFIEYWIKKYPDKTIWLYTGDVWENVMNYPLMQYVDVLVDGEFMIDLRDPKLQWKGSSNQRVIDVKKTLKQDDISIPVLHCGDYS